MPTAELVTQLDQPFGSSSTMSYALPLPRLLPPGDYRLIAALYDPGQPDAPRILTADGADHVEMGVFRVE